MADFKVLVTGGAGFIGSVLASELLKEGWDVTVVDNLMWGKQGVTVNLGKRGFSFVEGDFTDPKLISQLLKDKDVIVNLAAYVGNGICEKHKIQATNVNVNGSKTLASNLSDNQLLICASTGSVYGSVKGYCTEKTVPNPQTHYAVTKIEAENVFLKRKNTVVLRFATAFGVSPRMRLDLLVNQFIYEAVKNKSLLVFDGNSPRSIIHVKDFARSIIFAIKNGESMQGQIFNVGSSEVPLTKHQIAQHIRRHVDFDLQVDSSGKDNDGRDYFFSSEKIQAYGFHTEVSLDEGIMELICTLKNLEVNKNCFNSYVSAFAGQYSSDFKGNQ